MIISGSIGNIKAELSRIKKEQKSIEDALAGYQRKDKQVADMGFYRLRKKRSELRDEYIKLNGLLHPDTIA